MVLSGNDINDHFYLTSNIYVVYSYYVLELIFGYEETEYSVTNEQQSSVNATVKLIHGVLEEYFIILLATTQDGTALGKLGNWWWMSEIFEHKVFKH